MNKSLFKSTGIVSAMTFISRILGFVRDMLIAHLFGAGAAVDAFLVAFKIPNFLRRLFAEGAFSQAFVPVISEYKAQRSHQEVQQFVNHMAGNLGAVLCLVTLISVIAAPLLVTAFAPGFEQDSARFILATDMLRITFPYLLLISLTAFAGAILNTYSRFAVPSFTPVLLNISMIIAAMFIAPHMETPIFALAWGVFLGGVIQLLFQLPFLKRLRLLPKPKISWRDPASRRVIKLMVPAILGVSVAQISLLVDTIFASFLQAGSISWLYYSERLMTFPLGVFGVALATVVLPYLSKKHAEKSVEEYSATLDWAIRCVFLIGIPAAIGLFLLAGPLLASLFQYGEFTDRSVIMAQYSLWAFALGVPGFMLIKVLASGFYARQNIRTPVNIAIIALILNMVLNAALIIPFKHAGLALATTLSGTLNACLLYYSLKRRKIFIRQPGWMKFLGKSLTANIGMAAFLYYSTPHLSYWLEWSWEQRFMQLAWIIPVAIIVYIGLLYIAGIRLQDIRKRAL